MPDKTLADLIIEHGPYVAGSVVPAWAVAVIPPGSVPTASQINALRDELIELRADRAELEILRPAAHQPCPAGISCWQLDEDAPPAGPVSPPEDEQCPAVGQDTPEPSRDDYDSERWRDYHWGRSFTATPLEDACLCRQHPCGLVSQSTIADDCDQHGLKGVARTRRQGHAAADCPGTPA